MCVGGTTGLGESLFGCKGREYLMFNFSSRQYILSPRNDGVGGGGGDDDDDGGDGADDDDDGGDDDGGSRKRRQQGLEERGG